MRPVNTTSSVADIGTDALADSRLCDYGLGSRHVTRPRCAPFLLPDGFGRPALRALLREGRVVVPRPAGYALDAWPARRRGGTTPYAARARSARDEPVLLIPGFMAGDGTLRADAPGAAQQRASAPTAPHIHANVGCTLNAAAQIETRLESIAERRGIAGADRRSQPRRHAGPRDRRTPSRPGLRHRHDGQPDARAGRAPRAPDSAASPCWSGCSRAGLPRRDVARTASPAPCAAAELRRGARSRCRPASTFTAIYSRRDGIVDWRACVDPGHRGRGAGLAHRHGRRPAHGVGDRCCRRRGALIAAPLAIGEMPVDGRRVIPSTSS